MPAKKVSRETNDRSGVTAWLYAAVSTGKQTEDLAWHEAWARSVCTERRWRVTRVFSDDGTGKHGVRKLLQHLITELKAAPPSARPDVILMNRLDRVGRGKIVDSQVALKQITDLGVRVFTRDKGFVQNETWMDELINSIAFAAAQQEKLDKADRSRAGHARRRSLGMHPGHAPYGTVLIDGRTNAYEPEAVIVRQIFALRLKGWGVQRLTKWAGRTAPPKRKRDGSFREMQWSTGTLAGMLRCRSYRGIVIDEKTFDAVQAMRKPGRRREAIYPWPLRGALHCTCGYTLTGMRGGSGPELNRYYHCKNIAKHQSYPLHRADALEAQFVDLLQLLSARPERLAAYQVSPEDAKPFQVRIRALERQRADLEKRKSATWDIAEAGNISPMQLRERLDKIEGEIAAADEAIVGVRAELAGIEESLRLATSAHEAIALIAEAWPHADIDDQQEMAAAIAAAVGGLWVAPGKKRCAAQSRIQPGFELRPDYRFTYEENCTLIRNYANREAVAQSPI